MPARKPRQSPAKRLKALLTLVSAYNDVFRGVVISTDEVHNVVLGKGDATVTLRILGSLDLDHPDKRRIRFEFPKGTRLSVMVRDKFSNDVRPYKLHKGDTSSWSIASVFKGDYEIYVGRPLEDED